jgi:hypothetical protein
VIEKIYARVATPGGTGFDGCSYMRTIQISIGEIIEAMFEELVETYGD